MPHPPQEGSEFFLRPPLKKTHPPVTTEWTHPKKKRFDSQVYHGPVHVGGYRHNELMDIFTTNVVLLDEWETLQFHLPEYIEKIVVVSSQDKVAVDDIVHASEPCTGKGSFSLPAGGFFLDWFISIVYCL